MNIKSLREKGKIELESAGILDAQLDSDLLLSFVTGIDKNDFILLKDKEIEEKNFFDLINLRKERVPLQHILGKADFYGHEFKVSKDCLIPRFDTEILVENVSKDMFDGIRVLDLFTGSGCIIISLALLSKQNGYFAGSDISKKALDIAKINADNLNAKVDFFLSDMTLSIQKGERFDIITANPPYIKSKDIKDLEVEVKDHDPILALDGGEDGLTFYKRLADEAKGYLKEGGKLFMEIGFDQAEDVQQIFLGKGYKDIRIIKDYSDNDRVAVVKG